MLEFFIFLNIRIENADSSNVRDNAVSAMVLNIQNLYWLLHASFQ